MRMILFFFGMVIIYAAFKSIADAGKMLPSEFLERFRETKIQSPLMFAIYISPYVAAYLIYEQFPRFAWQIIFLATVVAAIEFSVWYYSAILKLKAGGFPEAYVIKVRRGYSMFGVGAIIVLTSSLIELFK